MRKLCCRAREVRHTSRCCLDRRGVQCVYDSTCPLATIPTRTKHHPPNRHSLSARSLSFISCRAQQLSNVGCIVLTKEIDGEPLKEEVCVCAGARGAASTSNVAWGTRLETAQMPMNANECQCSENSGSNTVFVSTRDDRMFDSPPCATTSNDLAFFQPTMLLCDCITR